MANVTGGIVDDAGNADADRLEIRSVQPGELCDAVDRFEGGLDHGDRAEAGGQALAMGDLTRVGHGDGVRFGAADVDAEPHSAHPAR